MPRRLRACASSARRPTALHSAADSPWPLQRGAGTRLANPLCAQISRCASKSSSPLLCEAPMVAPPGLTNAMAFRPNVQSATHTAYQEYLRWAEGGRLQLEGQLRLGLRREARQHPLETRHFLALSAPTGGATGVFTRLASQSGSVGSQPHPALSIPYLGTARTASSPSR